MLWKSLQVITELEAFICTPEFVIYLHTSFIWPSLYRVTLSAYAVSKPLALQITMTFQGTRGYSSHDNVSIQTAILLLLLLLLVSGWNLPHVFPHTCDSSVDDRTVHVVTLEIQDKTALHQALLYTYYPSQISAICRFKKHINFKQPGHWWKYEIDPTQANIGHCCPVFDVVLLIFSSHGTLDSWEDIWHPSPAFSLPGL